MNAALLNNRYRILETLGRGGFGETFLAEDTHLPSGRKCVIKQLKPIVEQPRIPPWMKQRFQREAAILEELGAGHPQIPQLYAYFAEAEKFYLVQEWIAGLNLAQKWEQQGNLDPDQVSKLLSDILPVLAHVHSRRIVHRDIKPENIILRDGDRLPVLIDFGAVKETMTTVVNTGNSSAFSAAIGTPGFMPSEQAAGRPVYSSDLYSLGLTAIFLLTGKSPQELETDPRTGEIIWQPYANNLDEKLVSILDRAVRFHPRDRFASAQAMLAALSSIYGVSNLTGATMKVAPAKSYLDTKEVQIDKTNAFAVEPASRRQRKKGNWLVNLFLLLLLATGISVGAFVVGFTTILNLWRSRPVPSPQARVEQPTPAEVPTRPEPEPDSQAEELPEEATEAEKEERVEAIEPDSEVEREVPEVVIETKPDTSATESQSAPKPEIDVPIVTTGTSESQLVSTLGEPTSAHGHRSSNNRTLVYHNIVPDRVNLRYKSDNRGKIRQADVALAQSVSLGAMQGTLTQLVGSEPPAAIKEKLRQVYSRQTDFSFFRVGNLEGKVERDAKDRVSISVWESDYQ